MANARKTGGIGNNGKLRLRARAHSQMIESDAKCRSGTWEHQPALPTGWVLVPLFGRRCRTERGGSGKKHAGYGGLFPVPRPSGSAAKQHHPSQEEARTEQLKEKRRRSLDETARSREKKTNGVDKSPTGHTAGFHLLALFTLLTSAACRKLPPRLKRPRFGPHRLSDVSEGDTIGSVMVLGDKAGLLSLEAARAGVRLVLGRRTSLSLWV